MPILLLLVGLMLPRVTGVLLWVFSDWFTRAFGDWIIPLLGLLFLPYSILWYSVVVNWFGGTWGIWQIVFMGFAIAFDLSSYSGIRHEKRE